MERKCIFLAWAQTARRASTLAKVLDAKLILLPVSSKNRIARLINYFYLVIRTLTILNQEKPDLVFVQCPPIQILFPVYLYTKFQKSKFIIDAHTGAFIGKGLHFPFYQKLLRFFAFRAKLTIIPNQGLAKFMRNWQFPFFILEDGLPSFKVTSTVEKIEKSVVMISGMGKDEPLSEVLEATKMVPEIKIFVTGQYKDFIFKQSPPNLSFTGFLPEADYIKLLSQVDLIMVLTTRPDTILCGAFEALSLEKPMVLSDTSTLRQHFPKGVIYIENSPAGIAQGIKNAFLNLTELKAEAMQLKAEKTEQWAEQVIELKSMLGY